MKLLSIIVPCYNEQESILIFYKEILKIIYELEDRVKTEIIFVDDGSNDNTLKIIKELHDKDEKVKYVSFSRNFGKESAIYAGFEKSKGDFVVLMDVDLQDPPNLIPEMLNGLTQEAYDCVATRRVTRKGEPPIRSFFARCFYKLINKISKTEIVDGARDYRMMTRQAVNNILSLKEYNRFSKGIFSWVGPRTKWIEYENIERKAGETKWSFWKLLIYSLEGIIAFSTVPLAIALVIGAFLCVIGLGLISVVIINMLFGGKMVSEYFSIISLIILIGGIQLFCTGILGQYLAKAYLEAKRRPIYIVREETE